MNIKCIGCYDLLREELIISDVAFKGYRRNKPENTLVVYICPRFFPYACALSGLLHPGSGIIEAVKDCNENPEGHCILCSKIGFMAYGDLPLVTCKEHYKAWSKWLDAHPERLEHIRPRSRVIRANWVEVFREFIEDMRQKANKQ